MVENETYKNLLQQAKEVSFKAYAPYSKFSVGAAVLFENGEIVTGCNVENVSYGLSLCAERNAISTAISKGINSKIKAIAVFSPNQEMCLPCGACRQWLNEFCINEEETKIILEENKEPRVLMLKEIFPFGFKINEK